MNTVATLACSSPWLTSISSSSSSSSSSKFLKYQSRPSLSTPGHRVVYCCGFQPEYAVTDLEFVLHDALDSSGVDTSHARKAREGFLSQIERLSSIERQTSISINRRVDLAKTALYIAAEDDSLVSHSSVPLPVDAFVERLDDLSTGYLSFYNSSFGSSPEIFLECLENYLYGKKGFRRSYYTKSQLDLEPRALYLHSVLTHRSGSAAMLSLIYSEMLKMLRLWTIVDFDCEIFFPHDLYGLPRGYHKLKSKESDQLHIMTTQSLLVEVLKNLKEAFWPFQHDNSKTLFLSAAEVANCTDRSNVVGESGLELASAKAAQHRLERGVWNSIRFGDMRRALSACERLVLLRTDPRELRDYSILLYHCGFFEKSLQYLKLYQETKSSSPESQPSNKFSILENDAVERLMVRLNLILIEKGWSKASYTRNFFSNNSEPCSS